MIITKNGQIRKVDFRLRPKKSESLYIQYVLKQKGFSCADIAKNILIQAETVLNVVTGRRRSRRVEAEIARVLGKTEWNDVVIEARLAVANPAYTPTFDDIRIFKERELANFMTLADPHTNFLQTRSDLGLDKEAV